MLLTQHAAEYCSRKSIAKTPLSNCRRFASIVGNLEVSTVTQQHVEQFVSEARKHRIPEASIRGIVKDVRSTEIPFRVSRYVETGNSAEGIPAPFTVIVHEKRIQKIVPGYVAPVDDVVWVPEPK